MLAYAAECMKQFTLYDMIRKVGVISLTYSRAPMTSLAWGPVGRRPLHVSGRPLNPPPFVQCIHVSLVDSLHDLFLVGLQWRIFAMCERGLGQCRDGSPRRGQGKSPRSPREVKMVNGFRYYRALENVSIESPLSTTLTIYPCQIRVHQR